MSQTTTRHEELRKVADHKLNDLATDATQYLQAYLRLRETPPEADEYHQASVNVHMAVTILKAHSDTTLEVLDEALDALPDDNE